MVASWNGVSILASLKTEASHADSLITSGGCGCRAFHNNEWFQMQWDSILATPLHITTRPKTIKV